MKNILLILFTGIGFFMNAQSYDYNTKKGFAVNGYDVVSYFDNEAKEGNNKFVAAYDDVNYKFSSQKNLDFFNKTPQKYLPEYGGYCAYAVALKGKKISVDPETFEVRDGKLYLFYNSWGTNTLESWKDESPEDLIVTGDKNWKRIKQ
ncbi:MAG: YHS domain-containing protein [Flavobacteriaceae bacterium]|jgi:YHS domain-containing protein|uniref:YHS domain-containing (seleno)protein n=1 Tax=Candidatus Marifrigoribacter sp. Uisw_064 TaxID=3230970 RepID=UPI003AE14A3F